MSNKRSNRGRKKATNRSSSKLNLSPEVEEQGKQFWRVVVGVTIAAVVLLYLVYKSVVG